MTDNTWEDENNVYSTDAIKEFKAVSKQQFKKSTKNPLTAKKVLLHNTFDPDTRQYTKNTKKTIVKKQVIVQKRQRDLIETETESVTVSKPIKEVLNLILFFSIFYSFFFFAYSFIFVLTLSFFLFLLAFSFYYYYV